VVVGHDGVAVFEALHRRHKVSEALLFAFDLRLRPLSERKAKLARLLRRAPAQPTACRCRHHRSDSRCSVRA
jgi:hypothetical protein